MVTAKKTETLTAINYLQQSNWADLVLDKKAKVYCKKVKIDFTYEGASSATELILYEANDSGDKMFTLYSKWTIISKYY